MPATPPPVATKTTGKATKAAGQDHADISVAPAPAEDAVKGKGLRALRDRIALRRSFSTRHSSVSSPTLVSSSAAQADAEDDVIPTSATSQKRLTFAPFERLITRKLGSKSSRGRKKTKTSTASRGIVDARIPVAQNSESVPSDSSASNTPEDEHVDPLPAVNEADIAASVTGQDPLATVTDSPDPEPLPLAQKIQSLLSSLPPFLSFESSPPPAEGQSPQDGSGNTNGDVPAPISDSRLISILSSPTIMNGSLSRGRQSVWAMLDNLRLNSLKSGADAGTSPPHDVAPGADAVLEDDDSVMFYGPLVPNASSSVELARSEIVSVDENGTIVEVLLGDAPPPQDSASRPPSVKEGVVHQEGFSWPWPFHRSAPTTPAQPKTVEKRVWVPSTDQLSLQVMWWGFRLWLPPPVLALLNDKEIEAAKLSAMLTTALQWLLNNVPQNALPPTLQPALSLVKSLVPYLGYIGGFVAWSWSAIKGFDIGYGVTLTATWLLPIALVPGTWEAKDVPQPPASSSPPAGNPASPPADPSTPGTTDPTPPGSTPASTPPPSTGSVSKKA